MEAVILAAGAGTRMRPLSLTRPKVLLPVAGEPLIHHVLTSAVAAGATRVHLIVHHGAGQIRNAVGKAHQGVDVVYHEQGEARGTGHAVSVLDPAPREPFLLLSADTLVAPDDLKRLAKKADEHAVIVGAHEAKDPRPYGALETQGDRLVQIHEKSDDPPSSLVNTGTYLLPPDIKKTIARLPASKRGEIELTDAINERAAKDAVHVERLETWVDVGRPWDLLRANQEILENRREDTEYWTREGTVEEGARLVGPVRVEKDAVVRTGCVIEGPAVIQAHARVGPLAYIRAHSVIGRSCHVGAHTEVKNSILFDDANAPHLNYVGDSILGVGVNLGAGTVIANLRHDKADIRVNVGGEKVDSGRHKLGAILGDRVKTGVNVSLDCGTTIGPGALLAPGQAFRNELAGDRIHYGHGKTGPKKR